MRRYRYRIYFIRWDSLLYSGIVRGNVLANYTCRLQTHGTITYRRVRVSHVPSKRSLRGMMRSRFIQPNIQPKDKRRHRKLSGTRPAETDINGSGSSRLFFVSLVCLVVSRCSLILLLLTDRKLNRLLSSAAAVAD